jgi:16S rRNA (cytidine1402-2'-O)-methyltransferase
MAGRIVLVATPIGNLGDLSPRAERTLAEADVICCEDTRHTRKLLSAAGISGVELVAVHEHNEAAMAAKVAARAAAGEVVAVVTDAGLPGISDPGARVVEAAARAEVPVEVIPGPSAVVAALVVSGLPTDRFSFEGFLPRRGGARRARLLELAGETRTAVLYESPHHLEQTLEDLLAVAGPLRRIALVRELTKVHEEVWRGRLDDALEHVRAGEPMGEHVIVLAGGRPPEITDDEIADALDDRFADGDTVKGAVAAVTAELGVAKRRVYALALARREGP